MQIKLIVTYLASILQLAIGGQLFYCTSVPQDIYIVDGLESNSDETESEHINATIKPPEGEILRMDDCTAALLIKPIDEDTEKLISKCIERNVLQVKLLPFIVVGDYELPDDRFPALFVNKRLNNLKEPYDFIVHWFSEESEAEFEYEDRDLQRATPLQVAVNVMRRGFKQAQKVVGQIIKYGTKPMTQLLFR